MSKLAVIWGDYWPLVAKSNGYLPNKNPLPCEERVRLESGYLVEDDGAVVDGVPLLVGEVALVANGD